MANLTNNARKTHLPKNSVITKYKLDWIIDKFDGPFEVSAEGGSRERKKGKLKKSMIEC